MIDSKLDLSKLKLDRSPVDVQRGASRRGGAPRRWLSRYALPTSILLGFVALLCAAAGQQLFSRKSVTVVPVIVQRGAAQPSGTAMFKAAGWVEPRPTSVTVAALAPGVIQELLVVAGQSVTQGEAIARLIEIDARLAVDEARAKLARAEADRQRAEAELAAAFTRLEQPVHLRAQLAEAESLLAKTRTETEKLPFLLKAAAANVTYTRASLDGKTAAKDAVAGVVLGQAIKEHATAMAELEELRQLGPSLQRETNALQEKVDALRQKLELLVEERRLVAEGKAQVLSSTAAWDEADVRLRQAQLNLERTVVRAPIDGRILRLIASPGTRVMGLAHVAGQSSSTVAEMYDPTRLQVRADVRLEDVPMITPGARVEITTASSPQPIQGRVLQSTSSANIQKNTLEVKVELIDPPPTVSPEMLVHVTFLATRTTALSESGTTATAEQIFAPKQLAITVQGQSAFWIVGPDNTAVQRPVSLGADGPDGLVHVRSGLNATDKLIASGLDELATGDIVEIEAEDQVIGVGE